MLSALRRRSGLLRAARHGGGPSGTWRVVARTRRRRRIDAGVRRQHGGARHSAHRPRRRSRRDHGLHAALHAARTAAPADDDRAAHRAAGGQPAHRRAPAAGVRVRPHRARRHHGQPPHPLRRPRLCAAPDDRCVDHGDPRGAAVLRRGHDHALPRRRRPDPGAPARTRTPFHRGDARVLARVGARPRDSLRVAERRHPRGDYAEAQRVRRHRRDHRRDDDVDPGGCGFRAQLGLSLSAGCAMRTSSSMR